MTEKKRLLAVDDDVDLLLVLQRKLEKTGRFEVTTASNGMDALRLAREMSPDLLLLDIEMPDMDGTEVAAALGESEVTKAIPILFLSSMIQKEDVAASGGKSGQHHIASKSMTAGDLVARIDSLLGADPSDS